MPLRVWKAKGFNEQHILQKSQPSDIRTCPVLGTVYRVAIMASGSRGSEGTNEAQRVDILPRSRVAKRKKDADEPVSAADTIAQLQEQLAEAKKLKKEENLTTRMNESKLRS